MGLGAIDYAIHRDRKPGKIVVTDIDDLRLGRAAQILPPEYAAKNGVKLIYIKSNDADELMKLTDGHGYDDVFVFAPIAPVVELGDSILGRDGCLNFFAGPTNPDFTAHFNFYDVHYASTHIVGTTGGNTSDMIEALAMMEKGLIDPAAMITHIGGLDCVIDVTLNLDTIPGGKKLIYTHISMPLTAIAELGSSDDPVFKELAGIVKANNGIWCGEAEKYLLKSKG
jgi:threonine dehydrogenase-like Zn-dependent dehydrogenase